MTREQHWDPERGGFIIAFICLAIIAALILSWWITTLLTAPLEGLEREWRPPLQTEQQWEQFHKTGAPR